MGQLLWRLQQIHLAACIAAKPDPEALAARLFRWELEGDWDTFSGAAQTYADVLGDAGIAHYRELAEAEWGTVEPLEPSDGYPDRDARRFRITQIMESLARLSGNLEQLIAIKQRDLSSSYAFLEIFLKLPRPALAPVRMRKHWPGRKRACRLSASKPTAD
jgi:hypothetical protein